MSVSLHLQRYHCTRQIMNDAVKNLLDLVIENEDVIDGKINVLGQNQAGDGYLGTVNNVEIIGKNKRLNLIVKIAPVNEKLRGQAPIAAVYATEINFYTKLYPALREFQAEHGGGKPFIKLAKCYATCKKTSREGLVLQNLKADGYKIWPRQKHLSVDHVKIVLREYGKFHAMSYALKLKADEKYRELTCEMKDCFYEFVKDPGFNDLYTSLFDDIKNIPEIKENYNMYNTLEKCCNGNLDFFKKLATERDQYTVITHGDGWTNNMLFKYDVSSKFFR